MGGQTAGLLRSSFWEKPFLMEEGEERRLWEEIDPAVFDGQLTTANLLGEGTFGAGKSAFGEAGGGP